LRRRGDGRQVRRERRDAQHRAARAGRGVAFMMVPSLMLSGRVVGGGRVMVSVLRAVTVRRTIAMHVHDRNRFVLCRRDGDGQHLIRKTRRRPAAERQRDARARDANEIGKGDQPSCRNSNLPP
jgi:hypothetical protein